MSDKPGSDEPLDPLLFAACVAHQLKSPIGAAGSLLNTLLADFAGPLTPHQRDLLGRIDRRMNEAGETVRRVLTLLRPENATTGTTDLSSLLGRLHQEFLAEAGERDLTFRVETPGDPVHVRGSEDALFEAFHALIANALKYTPPHGEVVLRASRLSETGPVRGEVADSGIGIPEEQRERIFQPFYRAPAAKGSTLGGVGLGLALVRSFVQALGGAIYVGRSDLGGASFVIELPEGNRPQIKDTPYKRKVVIIGGVAAGTKVAARIARLDPETKVTLIERGDILSYAGCGLPYYIAGVVRDKRDLMSTPLGAVRDPVFFQNVKHVQVMNRTEAIDIDRLGRVVRVRPVDGSRITTVPYDKLVIATGAYPIRPSLTGVDLANIFTLHGVRDAEGIRAQLEAGRARDVVIVGGGLIGVETTEALVSCGCRVTIVEMEQQILQMLDADMAHLLERHMEAHGVRVLTCTRALRFVGKARVEGVETDAHGMIRADLVILGVGVKPESSLARAAGLEIGKTGGILVDRHMLTSDSNIYAAGDCVESRDLLTDRPCYLPLGSTANKQGRVAAMNLCGGSESFPGVLGSTVCKVFDYCVGRTGLTECEARNAGFQVVVALATAPDREHFMPGARMLMLKLVADASSRRLLGLQTLGTGGDKRVDVAATAIAAGMTVDQVSNLDLCYAPPYSPAMDNLITAANIARNKLDGRLLGISPQEVWERLQKKEDFILLDVGTVAEHEAHRLPGSILIPLGVLRARLHELPRDRDIVTFCRLSIRGYEASLMLRAAGFERVRVLDGGSAMWPYESIST